MVGKLNHNDDHQEHQRRHADADADADAVNDNEDEDDDDDDDDVNNINKVVGVFQDDFRFGHGNALQAAVATIFGLQLLDVPNFIDMPGNGNIGYELAIQQFCTSQNKNNNNNSRRYYSMIKKKINYMYTYTTADGNSNTNEEDEEKDKDNNKMMIINPISLSSNKYDNKLCILRGKSPRGDFGHVVVARKRRRRRRRRSVQQKEEGEENGSKNNVNNDDDDDIDNSMLFEMIHDPHPDGTFLDLNEKFGWCMFFF